MSVLPRLYSQTSVIDFRPKLNYSLNTAMQDPHPCISSLIPKKNNETSCLATTRRPLVMGGGPAAIKNRAEHSEVRIADGVTETINEDIGSPVNGATNE